MNAQALPVAQIRPSETTHAYPKCPTCGHESQRRIHRPWWMRLFKGSMAFECNWCERHFMVRQ
jgi:predicted RNA-binding Zn-ribbon protein involved in translation (DUF1610 family)